MNRISNRARGFTLIEALIASVILSLAVIAVGAAVSAGQGVTYEGEKRLLATVVADNFMTDLTAVDYADLNAHDGLLQPVGSLRTIFFSSGPSAGIAYPPTFDHLGVGVSVTDENWEDATLGVKIKGKRVAVTVFDEQRTLAAVETYIPE